MTAREIENVIGNMKTGNVPGPDGLPSEFYKTFAPKLVPLPCRIYKEVIDEKALPRTMSQAMISVLLKKNKDPLKCKSYHLGCD